MISPASHLRRALWRLLLIELLIVLILGTMLAIAVIKYMEIIHHDEWPIYRANPSIVGPLIGREFAAIAPLEIDTICGDGSAKALVIAWRESGLPRIDRVRRHLSKRRWLVRAMFENTSAAERAVFRSIVCQPELLTKHTGPRHGENRLPDNGSE